MAKRYPKVQTGEWVQPVKRGYGMACCDCSLVHKINFRVLNRKTGRVLPSAVVQLQASRDNRATAQLRRRRS